MPEAAEQLVRLHESHSKPKEAAEWLANLGLGELGLSADVVAHLEWSQSGGPHFYDRESTGRSRTNRPLIRHEGSVARAGVRHVVADSVTRGS